VNAKTVRYYLRNIDGLRQEISDLQADMAEYKAMYVENINVMFDPDPYQHTHMPIPAWPEKEEEAGLSNTVMNMKSSKSRFCNYSHVENLVVRRVSFIERLEKELFIKKNLLAAINCILHYLTPQEKEMLELRYQKNWPWQRIADKVHYSVVHLKKKDTKIISSIIENYAARMGAQQKA